MESPLVNRLHLAQERQRSSLGFPLLLLCFYVVVEYARPPFLAPIRPALILQILLLGLFIKNLGRVQLAIKDGYILLFLFLLGEMAILGPIAPNNFWALKMFLAMVPNFIFSLAFCLFIDSVRKLRFFLWFLVVVLTACAVDEILTGGRYVGGAGFLGDTNDVALAMNVMIPIGFFLALSHKGLVRFSYWGAVAIFVMANLSSFSRSGFVGMVAVGLLCWWKSESKIRFSLIFFLVILLFVGFASEEYISEIKTIRDGTQTATGRDRIELWKVAWKMFLDNPVLGVGQGNLTWQLGDYQYDEFGESAWKRSASGRAIHSVYVTVLVELGIVGSILFLLMIYNLLRKYFYIMKKFKETTGPPNGDEESLFLKNVLIGLSIGLVGYLVGGVFLSAFYYPLFWNLAGLITAVYMIDSRRRSEAKEIHPMGTRADEVTPT